MSTARFYCSFALSPHANIELPRAIAHHASHVLRLEDGDKLVLFDGLGGEYPGILRLVNRTYHVELGPHHPREVELGGAITLVQGLPAGNKMDWIVEKAVELGVHTLVPIAATRSVTQLKGERLRKRLAHWQRIAISASEQCGRNRMMQITELMPLDHWLAVASNHWCALCHPEANMPLAQALQSLGNRQAVNLLVGPEGGWTPAEQHAAQANGAITVKFGPRILRTETAGLALVAAAAALLGWT